MEREENFMEGVILCVGTIYIIHYYINYVSQFAMYTYIINLNIYIKEICHAMPLKFLKMYLFDK